MIFLLALGDFFQLTLSGRIPDTIAEDLKTEKLGDWFDQNKCQVWITDFKNVQKVGLR